MIDPYASHTVSLTLAWVFSIPVWGVFVAYMAKFVFEAPDAAGVLLKSEAAIDWGLSAWNAVCVLVVSPLRYALLQLVLAIAYGVQSGTAFLSALLLVLYVPIIFGLLYVVGVLLPWLLAGAFAGITLSRSPQSRGRLAVVFVALPFFYAAGYALFFLLLPCAAWTIKWLPGDNVLKATNGPARSFYQYVVEPDIPRVGPQLRVEDGDSALERLRSHVSRTYIGPATQTAQQFWLAAQTAQHFRLSVRYVRQAIEIVNRGSPFSIMPSSDAEQMLALYRAALHEAEQADVALLDARVTGLGAAYRDKFIPGLRSVIEGHTTGRNLVLLHGMKQLDEWGDWYTAHLADIRRDD